MIKRIKTAGLSEQEWQTMRLSLVRSGMVGGSDASTLLGLNPYKSEINMFYQAIGLVDTPHKMNAAMLHGKQLEEYVAKCWQYWDGTEDGWVENTQKNNRIKRYQKVKSILINDKYPALFANVDGKIVKHPSRGKEKGILEIKTISGYSSDMWEGGIPPSYYVQLQHYLLVTGYYWGEIMYLKDGRELGCVTFEEDKEMQKRILDKATEFKMRVLTAKREIEMNPDLTPDEHMNLVMGFEPEADATKAFDKFMSEKHRKRAEDVTIQADEQMVKAANDFACLQDEISALDSKKTQRQNEIKQYMERHAATIMMLPTGKVTWRTKFTVKV
jgi:putative phage-type endonuclease